MKRSRTGGRRGAGPPFPGRAALVGVAAAALLASPMVLPASAAVARPFASTSPFNVAIKTGPRLDPGSAAMVSRAARDGVIYSNLYEYGVPIYAASSSTPKYAVTCAMEGAWGRCPLSRQSMPIPNGATPQTGTDGAMVVIDPVNNNTGEYWRAAHTGSAWSASWGAVNSLTGSGWGGASTGAGASRLGGVVRVSEIAAGSISHALVLQSDTVCSGVYRAPALKTDGDSGRSDCLPEGARLQLDPSLDLNSLPGLTAGERTVAKALQVYGAYVIDRGGAPLSLSFERAPDATTGNPGAVYAAAGLAWDYYGLSHVPWSRLRVLTSMTG